MGPAQGKNYFHAKDELIVAGLLIVGQAIISRSGLLLVGQDYY